MKMLRHDENKCSEDEDLYVPLLKKGFPCYFCPDLSFDTELAVHKHNKVNHPKLYSKYTFKRRMCLNCRHIFRRSLNFRGLVSHIVERKCKKRPVQKPPNVSKSQSKDSISSDRKPEGKVIKSSLKPLKKGRAQGVQNASPDSDREVLFLPDKVRQSSKTTKQDQKVDSRGALKSVPVPPVRVAASKAFVLIRKQALEAEKSQLPSAKPKGVVRSSLVKQQHNTSCLSFMCRSRNSNTTNFCRTCRLKNGNAPGREKSRDSSLKKPEKEYRSHQLNQLDKNKPIPLLRLRRVENSIWIHKNLNANQLQ